ncbi:HAD family hydrolase [Idiomarina sp. Sol25]|uniref:HAD family hydrolase n=1 Tax=Idiomarina sp. Sol25 TaxID=3064000 RepID=UPI00294AE3EC|nr:HAD family hydrolase [Idiomarina sp. Sol25]MDV6328536.1 HAD family hydrolase [Idiomarina sp. Sol25]
MNLALFDFDGTITDCDTFTPFIKEVTPPERMRWGRLLLAPSILGYRAGLVSSSRIRQQVVKIGLKGFSKSEIDEKGLLHAKKFIPSVLRPEAMERLHWHQKQGDRIIVVSASLDVYLKPWCEQMGFELYCAELEVTDDVVTGRYLNGDCTGLAKAERVKKLVNLKDYTKVYAYGDTKEDDELLALADEKYFQWIKV